MEIWWLNDNSIRISDSSDVSDTEKFTNEKIIDQVIQNNENDQSHMSDWSYMLAMRI